MKSSERVRIAVALCLQFYQASYGVKGLHGLVNTPLRLAMSGVNDVLKLTEAESVMVSIMITARARREAVPVGLRKLGIL